MRRFVSALLLSLIFILFPTRNVTGFTLEECGNDPSTNVNECIDLFSQKIGELGQQKKTLASQIAQFDTQIKVTQLKISEAQKTIEQLEKEIEILGLDRKSVV